MIDHVDHEVSWGDEIYVKMDIEASEYDVPETPLTDPIAGPIGLAYVEWHRTSGGRHEARKEVIKARAPFPIRDWN